jgi:hypothetical protein
MSTCTDKRTAGPDIGDQITKRSFFDRVSDTEKSAVPEVLASVLICIHCKTAFDG